MLILWPGIGLSQVLHSERLANGSEFFLVVEPEATATTVAWPAAGEEGNVAIRWITRGDLTLVADVEAALDGNGPAPPVVGAVGGAGLDELRAAISRALAGREPAVLPETRPSALDEGGMERRLGAPGSDALVRLRLPLPPEDDLRRDAVDLLAEMIPGLLSRQVPHLRMRREGSTVVLERTVAPERAEEELSRLRLALARLAEAPNLDATAMEAVRRRLKVRRLAELEIHPQGAERLVRVWLSGGTTAIRRELFGLDSLTLDTLRADAAAWLAGHPGQGVLLLPAQALNPRFRAAPTPLTLANNLNAVILERPASSLSALALRPILLPDLDGETAALVLARLAARIRGLEGAPGWIRVGTDPAELELATAPDGFPELCEVLAAGLRGLVQDANAIRGGPGPKHRALQLMGNLLGLDGEGPATPARLLRPNNLALGAVVPDEGTAAEALKKFLSHVGGGEPGLQAQQIPAKPRVRAPMAGTRSALAVLLPVAGSPADPAVDLAATLLLERAQRLLPKLSVKVLRPIVPGRRSLVLVLEGETSVDRLDRQVKDAWKEWLLPAKESELDPVKRRVAVRRVVDRNGALGAARLCADVAAGAGPWRPPGEIERSIVAAGAEDLAPILAGWADFYTLRTTAAGPFPVEALPRPAR